MSKLIGPNIEAKMTKFEVKSGTSASGVAWSGLFLGFKVGSEWINPYPYFFPDPEKEGYEAEAERIGEAIDHVATTFLGAAKAAELAEASEQILEAFAKLVEGELKQGKFWTKQIYVKTIPDKKGLPTVPFPPFISTTPDMSYTVWEQTRYEEYAPKPKPSKAPFKFGGNKGKVDDAF